MPRVEVAEHGNRPVLMTPARLNAPQGARAIADLAHNREVADYMIVVIDWDGSHLWEKEMQAVATPIMYIYAAKYFHNIGRAAYIEMPIDLEEAFGQSNFTSEVAEEIVQHIHEEFEKKAYESTHMKGTN